MLDNSFHLFMARFWALGDAAQRFALVRALAPRLLGRLTGGHAGLKRRVLVRFGRQPARWQAMVVQSVLALCQHTLSDPIRRILAAWQATGARVVLATAAPDVYARALAAQIGADCVATSSHVGLEWCELHGPTKLRRCQALAAQMAATQVVVITDHPDDLPLLAWADEGVIQADPARFEQMARTLGPDRCALTHIDPTALQEGGGAWLWLDDRPRGPLDDWELRTILSKHRHALLYVGQGRWQRIGPGQSRAPAVLRRDCPIPPPTSQRLRTYIRRRIIRDWLGIFH